MGRRKGKNARNQTMGGYVFEYYTVLGHEESNVFPRLNITSFVFSIQPRTFNIHIGLDVSDYQEILLYVY